MMKNNNDKMMKYYLDEYCKDIDDSFHKEGLSKDDIEEITKKIKDIKYTQGDSVKNYLNYFYKYNLLKELGAYSYTEIDKLWLLDKKNLFEKNKSNSVTINNLCKSPKIKADTIFSTWGPLKHIIFLITKKELNKNVKDLCYIIENINEIFKKNDEISKLLKKFMELASTKGNVIEYPYYSGEEICFQKRGIMYNDLILKSLYECFDKGIFSVLFNEKSNFFNVNEWINKERLYYLFYDDKGNMLDKPQDSYNKNSIIDIKNEQEKKIQTSATKKWSEIKLTLNDMAIILDVYTNIINKRNEN